MPGTQGVRVIATGRTLLFIVAIAANLRVLANETSDNDGGNVRPPQVSDDSQPASSNDAGFAFISDQLDDVPTSFEQAASFQQPRPLGVPMQATPTILTPLAASRLYRSVFGRGVSEGGLGISPTSDGDVSATSNEAQTRATTDAGSLMGNSPSAAGFGVQRRSPIMNDPRIRGSRVGQLAGSGSYWVPARIDLDTAVSKLDSRNISDVTVIRGPYSVLFGPGFQFLNVALTRSPRFADGPEIHGETSYDYKTNGQQMFGRQSVSGGDKTWGYQVSYNANVGNSYVSGNGTSMPANFNSQEFNAAIGWDLTPDSYVEVNYLHLDQKNLLLPGQVFDIDHLNTDAFEAQYGLRDQPLFDELTVTGWTNNTGFNGDANRPTKQEFFPTLSQIHYVGFTDVTSISTGYSAAMSWNCDCGWKRTIGTDMRQINQSLAEISSGTLAGRPPLTFSGVNSPIPPAFSRDFGVFANQIIPVSDQAKIASGVCADWTNTAITQAGVGNSLVGPQQIPYSEVVGSSNFNQTFQTVSAYTTIEYALDDHWTLTGATGTGQKAPSLTELYAAQPFMALIQNGLNTVTGDPNLKAERIVQTDLSLTWKYERFRGNITGFQAWAFDYITFKNIGTVYGSVNGIVGPEQVNLKYVNTSLATFAGTDALFQYDVNDVITPFGVLNYVDGRNRNRNGSGSQEPLPQILPFNTRLGVRIHSADRQRQTWVEMSTRIVAAQDRVATSLLETPTPGFNVWDLRGSWQVCERFLLISGVENFTNVNYQEHLDYRNAFGQKLLQPGITFYFGTDLTY